jgi:hypothetical protein
MATAKDLICVIKTEDLERSLIHHMSVASLDAFEGLAAAVEGAQGRVAATKCLVFLIIVAIILVF